ncbi:unannotated protein [freshwater metagenome]|uniref:Unannotated protein n=1 Tax=freshwater metagenome TaxID=449393 RepID=A0A6J6V8C1_9ZZZZ
MDPTLLHLAGHHSPTTRDREHILDRHQERLVELTLGLRDRAVTRIHQLHQLLLPHRITLQRLQRRNTHHRRIITRELILGQQLTDLKLHQVQQLLIINHVSLVQSHNNVRNTHLTGQKHMLTRLRHRTISRSHHQNRTINLRSTRDHVLDVVSMTRHINMRIMPILRLVLNMSNRDRDTTSLLLRRLINLIKRSELRQPLIRQRLRNRSRQRRLTMINMTHRPNIHMGLRTLELCLAHDGSLSPECCRGCQGSTGRNHVGSQMLPGQRGW